MPGRRSEILRRACDIIVSRTEELALLMGNPSIRRAVRWPTPPISPDGKNRLMVLRQSVGPCPV